MLIILVDRVVMKQGVERGILRGVPRPIAPRSTGDEIAQSDLLPARGKKLYHRTEAGPELVGVAIGGLGRARVVSELQHLSPRS